MDFSMLRTTSKVVDEWKYPQAEPRRSGMLPVDPVAGHQLYWEEYGAADGEPVMVLHGGPGGACTPAMSRYFDPDRYRVILFDQRGCGKSSPTVASDGPEVALANNTTDHLVRDINALREALGIEGAMHVFGGSWGSTLSLVYAIRHPQFVRSLILRGIFLGERGDIDYMYQGNARDFARQPYALTAPGAYIFYPDQWRAFLEPIADDQRDDMARAYKAIFDLRPTAEAERARQLRAAVAWSVWEGAISNMIPVPAGADKFAEPDFAVSFAQIEAHYFANGLFLDEGYIVRNAARLAAVPTYIVHGRFDQACPLSQAGRLASALENEGSHPLLVVTDAGHSAMERETVLALTAIMDGLPG
jgi:proline iminopeptidase